MRGDDGRLVQVVSNLMTNAARYTPPGGAIHVALAVEGAEAVLRVTDTGKGISPALLPRVFELFVQGEQTAERADGGLGLGLAIVNNLVRLHGGTVTAHSAGAGSTFTVRIATVQPAARARTPAREVAVLDIGLPGMDGYDLAGRMLASNPGCRLIALTGYGQAKDRVRALGAGFTAHLVKPCGSAICCG